MVAVTATRLAPAATRPPATQPSGSPATRRLSPLVAPAFVAAIAYIDPGNVATNLTAGASHGYLLVWVVVAASLVAMLVQYQAAKLGAATGRSLPRATRTSTSSATSGSGRSTTNARKAAEHGDPARAAARRIRRAAPDTTGTRIPRDGAAANRPPRPLIPVGGEARQRVGERARSWGRKPRSGGLRLRRQVEGLARR